MHAPSFLPRWSSQTVRRGFLHPYLAAVRPSCTSVLPSSLPTCHPLAVYSSAVDAALTQGNIALLFIDDGRLAEMGGDDVSPLVATDLWQAIKELAPHKVGNKGRAAHLGLGCRSRLADLDGTASRHRKQTGGAGGRLWGLGRIMVCQGALGVVLHGLVMLAKGCAVRTGSPEDAARGATCLLLPCRVAVAAPIQNPYGTPLRCRCPAVSGWSGCRWLGGTCCTPRCRWRCGTARRR